MFEGKVALVTGSSQGIGQVIATKFAEYGADVVVHGLGATDDCKTCQDIRAMGRRTAAYDVDITNVEAVNEMVKDIIAKFGKIDILINNAGMYPAMLVTDVTEKHFDRVIAVNLKGTFFVTQAVVNQSMIPNNYGRIVNISSCDGKTHLWEICRRIPTPSPVFPSASFPARCSRFSTIFRAFSTVVWLLIPLLLMTAPIPQLSCSNCCRYKP